MAVVPCGPIYKPDGQMSTGTLASGEGEWCLSLSLSVCVRSLGAEERGRTCHVGAHMGLAWAHQSTEPGPRSRPSPDLPLLSTAAHSTGLATAARNKSGQMKVGAGRA